jgi:hypothetical protein
VSRPKILFLDEPTSGLDSYTSNKVRREKTGGREMTGGRGAPGERGPLSLLPLVLTPRPRSPSLSLVPTTPSGHGHRRQPRPLRPDRLRDRALADLPHLRPLRPPHHARGRPGAVVGPRGAGPGRLFGGRPPGRAPLPGGRVPGRGPGRRPGGAAVGQRGGVAGRRHHRGRPGRPGGRPGRRVCVLARRRVGGQGGGRPARLRPAPAARRGDQGARHPHRDDDARLVGRVDAARPPRRARPARPRVPGPPHRGQDLCGRPDRGALLPAGQQGRGRAG